MQCRICLEDGDATDLIAPCQCRGTSSYIHRTCLDQYIQYYPDRICRVCYTPFQYRNLRNQLGLSILVFLVFLILLSLSQIRILMKLFLLGLSVLMTFHFFRRGLFSITPIVFLTILCLLFLPGGHPSATNIWFVVIAVLMIGYTLGQQVPAMVLLGILFTLLLSGYVMFLTMFAYHAFDTPAFTVYISTLYLGWYAWMNAHPRLYAG